MLKLIGKIYLKVQGWRAAGDKPTSKKYVLIAAPHTSNWDGIHMVGISWIFDLRIRWMAKHTLFEGRFGWFFRWTGGVEVDRRKPQGLVEQMAQEFARNDEFILAVPPEGTRSRREYWKSGFYQIALAAKVPIVLAYLDFANRVGGFGGEFMPSGDVKKDMDHIRAFYADKAGKRPELFAVPRLRAEDDDAESDANADATTDAPQGSAPVASAPLGGPDGGADQAKGAEAA